MHKMFVCLFKSIIQYFNKNIERKINYLKAKIYTRYNKMDTKLQIRVLGLLKTYIKRTTNKMLLATKNIG